MSRQIEENYKNLKNHQSFQPLSGQDLTKSKSKHQNITASSIAEGEKTLERAL